MGTVSPRLPRFDSLLKSRDVEDPINIWVHRPLAYAFVALVYRTPITPNQVTFLAMVVGIVAGSMWIWGSDLGMVLGGILLWTSGILDGADGILARAKGMASQYGRALDSAADIVVSVFTVFPAIWLAYARTEDPLYLVFALPAILPTTIHVLLYDYYKELFLEQTNLEKGGDSEAKAVAEEVGRLHTEGGSWLRRTAMQLLHEHLQKQNRLIKRLDPMALREGRRFTRNERTAAIYRKNNLGPMRIWTFISLAPHTYLLSICAIAGHIEVYLWIRLVLMNFLFVVVVLWQRRATEKTMRELEDIGAAPVEEVPQAA